jgi:hypothetical protein
MVLSAFRKPKWQHRDAAVRLAALQGLPADRQEIFIAVVRDDQDRQVRMAAIARLDQIPSLVELAGRIEDEVIHKELEARLAVLRHQAVLAADEADAALVLLRELHDPDLLADLAVRARQPPVRVAAVNGLEDQKKLAAIVEQNCGREAAAAAIARITRADLLARLKTTAAGKTARRLAGEKLATLEAAGKSPEPADSKDTRLHGLAAEAERLKAAPILDPAAAALEQLLRQWQELDPDFQHPAAAAFRAACTSMAELLEEVRARRSAEAAKAARYEEEQGRLEQLCLTIEKLIGSTSETAPTEVSDAEKTWQAALREGLNPSATLDKRFTQGLSAFKRTRGIIEEELALVAGLETRLAQAGELLSAGEANQAGTVLGATEQQLAELRLKHLSPAPLRERQTKLAQELAELKERRHQDNLAQHRRLCEQATALLQTENLEQAEAEAKSLRRQWQQLAPLSDREGTELTASFKEQLDQLATRIDSFHHEKDWQLWANLTRKQELLKKVEQLDEISDLPLVLKTIKESQAAWKEIGPAPQKLSRKLWDRFHAATDRNYQRCAPYLEELKNARVAALARKEEICLRAEELAESEQWQKTATAIKELQTEWQKLPAGQGGEEHRLFQRFRKACNHFFARRHAHYESGTEVRQANLLEKEKLCLEVEKIVADPRFNDAGRIRNLQGRWKKIGPVPKEQSAAVWQRFRSACDRYFAWLDETRAQNLARKEELCAAVAEILAGLTPESSLKEVGARLVILQQQWKEIGPVPQELSEEIWQRFHGPIDEFFQSRHQHFEEAEKERRLNLEKKEELLRKAEELAARGNTQENAAALQELQKQWQEAGSAPREIDRELNQQFKELCDSFFAGRRQFFTSLKEERLANQRRKESLCLRLENLLGGAPASGGKGKNQALSLAEQLKIAMEDNFMLAGRRDDKAEIQAEVKRIQEEWKKIGPAERKYDQALGDRFRKALDSFYDRQKKNS